MEQQIEKLVAEAFEELGYDDCFIVGLRGGVGRPLQFLRQYVKNIDRKVEVKTVQEEKVKGTLTFADEEKVVVTYEDKVKQGKKNVKITVNKEILMKDILETRVKISF